MDDFPAFAKIGDGAARNANPPRAARIIFFIFSSLRGNDIRFISRLVERNE
jgi:hypothetical protein